jgi:hypothetical protein
MAISVYREQELDIYLRYLCYHLSCTALLRLNLTIILHHDYQQPAMYLLIYSSW